MTKAHDVGPILVPVDFSPSSEAALLHAVWLARCLDSSLLVLHVVHDPGTMPDYYGKVLKKKQLMRIEDGAAAMLDDLIAKAEERYPEFKKLKNRESMLVKGLPSGRILEVADKVGASMIVLGSKGATGLKHLLMGSVAEQVARLAKIPVTIVKSAHP
ncbi:universal stress protein [Thiorhodococcus minor]|uniref:Universal stress protein n=1 Tax=Thiorhodococcus minor TaxID=57489 RepID=A0A6M0K494_9GAMM|nr:universal stress protein [Thiorhodococcus minor]NEV64094.1 universal stress protein [Thiorhodococcus minor]